MKVSINDYPIKTKQEAAQLISWLTVPRGKLAPKVKNGQSYECGITVANLNCKELVKAWTSGQTIAPALFRDNIKRNNNVLELQLYCVDVDGSELEPQDFYDQSPEGVKPAFAYYTFSHGFKPGNRFRLVYLFEFPLVIEQLGADYITSLIKTLNEICGAIDSESIDKQASALSQFFYGGRGEYIYWGDEVKIESLIQHIEKKPQSYRVNVELDSEETESALEYLVLIDRISLCCHLLKNCQPGSRNSTISKVASIIMPFNRNELAYEEIGEVFDSLDFWEQEHIDQFERIWRGGTPGSFFKTYLPGKKSCAEEYACEDKLTELLLNSIQYRKLNQELVDNIAKVIDESTLVNHTKTQITNKLVERINYVNKIT